MKRKMNIVHLLVLMALGFLVLTLLDDFKIVHVIGMLIVGWVIYVVKTLPSVRVYWPAIITACACLAGVLILGHLFARWLYNQTTGGRRWRIRWTLAITTVVVLLFACGIAAVGITHQTAWLARSDKPMFGYRGRETANRVKCGSRLRQLGQVILMHAQENGGRFPDTLEQLVLSQDITSELYVCPSSNTERAPGKTAEEQFAHLHRHNDYVYHGRGLTTPVPNAAGRPIACEPLINHHGAGMNILFADGQVDWFDAAEATRIMRTVAAE